MFLLLSLRIIFLFPWNIGICKEMSPKATAFLILCMCWERIWILVSNSKRSCVPCTGPMWQAVEIMIPFGSVTGWEPWPTSKSVHQLWKPATIKSDIPMENIWKVIKRRRDMNPIQWTLSLDGERYLHGIVKDFYASQGDLIEPSTTPHNYPISIPTNT